jgi:hypothetical protein
LVHDLLGRNCLIKTMRVIVTSIKKHSVAAIANRIYLLTVIDGDRKEVKKLVIIVYSINRNKKKRKRVIMFPFISIKCGHCIF